MFNTENVKAYLKSIVLDTDKDKRIARLRFFVGLTHDLATEASPHIADRLFRKNGDTYDPVLEVTSMDFAITFPQQSLSYRRSPDYVGHHVFIPNVRISGVSAQKLISGKPDFSLLFNCEFEITDKTVITDLIDLIHENFFITFRAIQGELFEQPDDYDSLLCRLCDAPNPEFIVLKTKPILAYCAKHVSQKADDEKVKRIRDSEAAAAVAGSMREPGDESENENSKGKDPLANDLNRRNQMSRRKKK